MAQKSSYNEFMRETHERHGTANKCYILLCGENPEVAIRGKQSGEIRFYCARCASELLETFSNLFEIPSGK